MAGGCDDGGDDDADCGELANVKRRTAGCAFRLYTIGVFFCGIELLANGWLGGVIGCGVAFILGFALIPMLWMQTVFRLRPRKPMGRSFPWMRAFNGLVAVFRRLVIRPGGDPDGELFGCIRSLALGKIVWRRAMTFPGARRLNWSKAKFRVTFTTGLVSTLDLANFARRARVTIH